MRPSATKGRRTHPDSQLAGDVEEHSDPLPVDPMLEHFGRHFLESVPLRAGATSHPIYGAATETQERMRTVKVKETPYHIKCFKTFSVI